MIRCVIATVMTDTVHTLIVRGMSKGNRTVKGNKIVMTNMVHNLIIQSVMTDMVQNLISYRK